MPKHSHDSRKPSRRSREAYFRYLNEIRALPPYRLPHITVDIWSVVATALQAVSRVSGLRAQITRAFPAFQMTRLERVQSYALALEFAQSEYETATEPPVSVADLAKDAVTLREILVADVNLLMARGIVSRSATRALKGVNGYKNIAADLLSLSTLLRQNRDEVAHKTSVTTAELNEAESLATTLTAAVAKRERAPAFAAQAARDRQATFALLATAYEDIRSLVGRLRRAQGDAETIAPSLFAGRMYRKGLRGSGRVPSLSRMVASTSCSAPFEAPEGGTQRHWATIVG